MVLCDVHRSHMVQHHCCPGCGFFCLAVRVQTACRHQINTSYSVASLLYRAFSSSSSISHCLFLIDIPPPSSLAGHVSRVLPRPAHRSPFPPGLCNRAGQRAQQGKRRRHALLPTLWRRCLRGPGGHHPLLQLGHSLRDHRRHHVSLLHHHPVSAAIRPHGALTHSLNRGDEGWEDA